MQIEKKFTHTNKMEIKKQVQANELAEMIINVFNPITVVDVGCGTASLLGALKKKGVNVTGFDGSWVNRNLLFNNIDKTEFIEVDLEKKINHTKRADVAVCLEVAEHLSSGRADSLVKDLCDISDKIVFSAAIPGQGGQNHINEQWLDYWIDKFQKEGYEFFDILRPLVWDNTNILWWYRQNMVVFVKKEIDFRHQLKTNEITNIIHPDFYITMTSYKDQYAVKRFLKSLFKAIFYRIGLIK